MIAGLPRAILGNVIERLQQRFPKRTFKGTPARQEDGVLYPPDMIEKLLHEVADFAIRRRSSGKLSDPAPRSIILAYVPAADDERLMSAFDFSVMPAPLAALAAYGGDKGRQYRHSADAAFLAVEDALGERGIPKLNLDEVKQRVARLANDSEVLLLPPENFRLHDRDRLSTLFRSYRRGERVAADRFPELQTQRLSSADIRRLGEDVRHCHVDADKRAFLMAHPAAYDGSEWELEEEKAKAAAIKPVLRSLYRFGAPLPDGFHHDVQFADGSAFANSSFDCLRNGLVRYTCPYVNVYPDDFVRPGKAKRARKGKNKTPRPIG
ncbi:hypothetical protein [Brevundimonas sp. ZS04]|uniref:hypothetical protein n=1 Tax=Brevundimonas sp. ZS04 TaxID=1906854 RepID=UPI001178A0C6|nr:hypothetical protein [Brevundimonas sp. ZS04]